MELSGIDTLFYQWENSPLELFVAQKLIVKIDKDDVYFEDVHEAANAIYNYMKGDWSSNGIVGRGKILMLHSDKFFSFTAPRDDLEFKWKDEKVPEHIAPLIKELNKLVQLQIFI